MNVVHWRGDGLYSNDDVDVHGDDHDGIYLLQPLLTVKRSIRGSAGLHHLVI